MEYRRVFRLQPRSERDAERELSAEIEAHIAMRAEALEKSGHTPEHARELAQARFGDQEGLRASVQSHRKSQRRLELLDEVRQDAVLSWRRARRAPAATLLSVATFALGIGLTTLMFTFVDRVLLRPLPYADPSRLMALQGSDSTLEPMSHVSYANWADWTEGSTVLSASAIHKPTRFTVADERGARHVQGQDVTQDFFTVLGTRMLTGRGFVADDAARGAVVVSEDFWRRELGGEKSIEQSVLHVNGRALPVVGVVRAGDAYPQGAEMWMVTTGGLRGGGPMRNNVNWNAIARLAPGVTAAEAQNRLSAVARGITETDPASAYSHAVHVIPLQSEIVASARGYLRLLFGAVVLVLLLACTNLAALNLARGRSRSGEMSVRVALGAGRRRLTRQLLTEQALLALAGGACGLVLAWWGTGVLARIVASELPRAGEVSMDARIVAFTIFVTAVAALCAGALPALRTASLGATGRSHVPGGRTMPGRMLVGAEVAIAVVLLCAGGLLLRSFRSVTARDLGFDPAGVASAELVLNGDRYGEHAVRVQYWETLGARAAADARVSHVAFANWIPTGTGGTAYLEVENGGTDPDGASYRVVSGGYFAAMGIDLLWGRTFGAADGPGTRRVAIVNNLLAERHWPGRSPIGQRIKTAGMEGYGDQVQWLTIVGVVDDIRHDGYESDASQQVYVLYSQVPMWTRALHVVARASNGNAADAASAITNAVRELDPQVAAQPKLLEAGLRELIAERTLTTSLITIFGALSLLLAAIGIYGLLSFSVAERTREIGVRTALGADRGEIISMVMRNGFAIVSLGALAGVVLALWLTRLLQSQLAGVSATDAVTYVTVVGVIGAAAVCAALVPALRAARVDPLAALRAG